LYEFIGTRRGTTVYFELEYFSIEVDFKSDVTNKRKPMEICDETGTGAKQRTQI
jgi:hypothetical protein